MKLHLFKYESNVKDNYNIKELRERKTIEFLKLYLFEYESNVKNNYNIKKLKERKKGYWNDITSKIHVVYEILASRTHNDLISSKTTSDLSIKVLHDYSDDRFFVISFIYHSKIFI